MNSSRQSDLITFSVRCGTSEGVVTHHLKVETHRDLANWARTIVQGCHTSVMLQRELSLRMYNLFFIDYSGASNAYSKYFSDGHVPKYI